MNKTLNENQSMSWVATVNSRLQAVLPIKPTTLRGTRRPAVQRRLFRHPSHHNARMPLAAALYNLIIISFKSYRIYGADSLPLSVLATLNKRKLIRKTFAGSLLLMNEQNSF